MEFIEIFLIAVGLSMDAFAVSLGAGTVKQVVGFRPIFRLSFHFGLFQFFMPILGWLAGITIAPVIAALDHWIAFGLLLVIGGKMIYAGSQQEARQQHMDPSRGAALVLLAIATSIDALAIGFSLAMLQVNIFYPSVIIGIVTATFSLSGVLLGRRLGEKFGKSMEIIGGGILVVMGIRILLSHLF